MSLPTLAEAGHPHIEPHRTGMTCAVHKHTEWVPLNDHHVFPQGMGGPNVKANKITVCTNGHYMIHEFIRYLIKHNGDVPWTIAQHFGPRVRDYARIGWEKAGSPTSGDVAE
jgi:hypothetical protein